jgi:hypothetical protein
MATALRTIEGFKQDGQVGGTPTPVAAALRHYIDQELEEMDRFRQHIGIVERLNNCLRLREGQYEAQQLAEIAKFGGSQVFARLTTNKIRGGAAMLRSIFIQGERPWSIDPTPVPTLPEDITSNIKQLVIGEANDAAQLGAPVDMPAMKRRMEQLTRAAQEQARKIARLEALESTRYVDDILTEGGFYEALDQFILDFTTYPYAVMAGPTAVMQTGVSYVNGQPTRVRKPVLRYRRVDPYDIMWSPGANDIGQARVIERLRMTRAMINGMIGLDGYDDDAIKSVLRDYGASGYSYRDFFEQVHEDAQNQGGLFYASSHIDVLCYSGAMAGRDLIEMNVPPPAGEKLEPDLDYQLQALVCGEYMLKVQIDPDPSARTNYYSAAYEPVSGSIPGTALPELNSDVQEVYNATLRGMVNNIGMASGPMIGLNRDRWQAPADGEFRVQPWMIIQYDSDPSAPAGEKPVEFYQPTLNGQELMNIMLFLQNMADEITGIPRYMTGSDRVGGAGRTSSGLSMLMGNANRTMTSVAGGVDRNVIEPCIQKTYDLVLLTTGTTILRGDEEIVARGATYAEKRETDRMRMNEFLQTTANPYDMQIMGLNGRAALLREVTNTFLPSGEQVVPSEQDMMMQQEAAKQQQQLQAAQGGGDPNQQGQDPSNGGVGSGPPQPGQQPGATPPRAQSQQQARGTDNMHRTRSPGAMARTGRGA